MTAKEKSQIAYYTGRMCKQSLAEGADLSDWEKKIDRVLDGAREREQDGKK
nr:DUF6257 family protein [Streptomyces sp. HNM0574]